MRRLAATLSVAFGVGAATLLPGAPALAATPHYVALVIAGHGTYCVRAGGSGDSVLNAVVEVGYRPSDHIIWQIDNYPSPPFTDSRHYWSYWHDTSGRWSYSADGANAWTPPAGSVEGWVFGNGSAPPPRNPAGLYAALCGHLDPQSPPPVRRTTTPSVVRTTAPRLVAPSSPSTVARRSSGRPSSSTVRRSSPPVPATTTPATTTPVASRSTTPAPASTSTRAVAANASGSAAPALAGAGLVGIIAAGGGWAAWRRRRG
ncbi:MAG TPA: hypothetical protein VGN18_06815 [Jatrophihabitans sp.]|jgi:hypothetical protein|uniref:hypothetical protein n=1 Tax=Jatrophihabitans sp. TaxID=1932789 RepID=UPI002DFA06B0|nr:hypothetical protein [Jatrophihabitans sp.]